jgi:RNA polymerase subunit RPABC4/transcription elongation factor Spt4
MSSNMSSGKPLKADNKAMQCNAKTKSGNQCKLAFVEGSKFCPVHQSVKMVVKVTTPSPIPPSAKRIVKEVQISSEQRLSTLKARYTVLAGQYNTIADEMAQIDNEISTLEATSGKPMKATTPSERCRSKTKQKTQCKLAKESGSDHCPVHNQ